MEARYAELLDERNLAKALLQNAFDQIRYWTGKSALEVDFWQGRARELQMEVNSTNARMRVVLSPDDRAHYGGREEEFEGASNGSIRWEG